MSDIYSPGFKKENIDKVGTYSIQPDFSVNEFNVYKTTLNGKKAILISNQTYFDYNKIIITEPKEIKFLSGKNKIKPIDDDFWKIAVASFPWEVIKNSFIRVYHYRFSAGENEVRRNLKNLIGV